MTSPASPALENTATSAAQKRAALTYAALCVMCLAMFYETARSLYQVWLGTPTFNHGFFIAPMSIYLVWIRRHTLVGVPVRLEPLAIPLVVIAGLIWLVGYAGDVQLFQHIGFVGILIALGGGVFGRYMLRKIWFPLAFLAFMVPAGDQLVPPLQDLTADFSVILLNWVNIPVWRDGVFLQVSNGLFEVAEACAGVRFLIANIVVAFVFAYLAYDKWWKWVIFIAISIIIPIFANGIRAFGIVYIAHVTDNEYAVGVDHLVYGWGFFTVVMLISLFIGNLFADRRVGDFVATPVQLPRHVPGWNWVIVAAAAIAAVIGPTYATLVISNQPWTSKAAFTAPEIAAAWHEIAGPLPAWNPVFRGPSAELNKTYSDGNDAVGLYIAYYPKQGQGKEVIYHANRMADDDRWKRLETKRITLTVDGAPLKVRLERMQGSPGPKRIAAYWYWIAGKFTSDPIEAKLYQIAGALGSGDRSAAAIAVTTLETDDTDRMNAALQKFLDATPNLGEYLARLSKAN